MIQISFLFVVSLIFLLEFPFHFSSFGAPSPAPLAAFVEAENNAGNQTQAEEPKNPAAIISILFLEHDFIAFFLCTTETFNSAVRDGALV